MFIKGKSSKSIRLKNSIILYILFIPLLLLISCEKDSVIPISKDENCFDFPLPKGLGYGYQYEQPQFSYHSPSFNPNNADEMVYIKGDYINKESQLRKFNLSTGQNTILAYDVWEKPDWGNKGWILFNHADNQVWKIKSNSDSLTQLTFDNAINTQVTWAPEGDKFIYKKLVGSDYYSIIADENGNSVDTIEEIIYSRGSWSKDDKIALEIGTENNYGVGYIDLTTYAVKQITYDDVQHTSKGLLNGLDWLTDSENIIWCSGNGVFRTNINTKQTTKLKTGCDSKSYIWPSISPEGNKVIVQRYDQTLIDDNTIYLESNIWIMNIDGSDEKKIEF